MCVCGGGENAEARGERVERRRVEGREGGKRKEKEDMAHGMEKWVIVRGQESGRGK